MQAQQAKLVRTLCLRYMLSAKITLSVLMPRNSSAARSRNINLRVASEMRGLIDQAARAAGKTRTAFILDATRRAAEEALLDQTYVRVDRTTYRAFLEVLDRPPSGEGFERLMAARKPWAN